MLASSSQGPRDPHEPNDETINPQSENTQVSNLDQLQSSATSQQREQATALTQQYIAENVETSNMTRQELDSLNEDVYKHILIRLVGGGVAGEIMSFLYENILESEIEKNINLLDDFTPMSYEDNQQPSDFNFEGGDSITPIRYDEFTPGNLTNNNETTIEREFDLQQECIRKSNNPRYRVRSSFRNIEMRNNRVVRESADQILSGTPLTWDSLQKLKSVRFLSYGIRHFENFVLPTALTIALVLKERGYQGENFLHIWKLGMATCSKESGCGSNSYQFFGGAAGISQFDYKTREVDFYDLPERERRQYPELFELSERVRGTNLSGSSYYYSRKRSRLVMTGVYQNNTDYRNYSDLLRNQILNSPTLSARLMINLLMKNVNRSLSLGLPIGTSENAQFAWVAYNIGPGRVAAALRFYRKFPDLPSNYDEAKRYLDTETDWPSKIKIRVLNKMFGYKDNRPKGGTYIKDIYESLTSITG